MNTASQKPVPAETNPATPQRPSSAAETLRRPIEPAAAWWQQWWIPFAVLVCGHLPFVIVDAKTTWQRTHYEFIPFAAAAFVGLFWSRQTGRGRLSRTAVLLVLTLLALDLCLLYGAADLSSPWLASLGMVCVCGMAGLVRADRETGRSLFPLAALIAVAVRLPANMDLSLVQRLQDITSRLAGRVLNFAGILHLREGNIIRLTTKDLMVEEACSGIQSLFTLIFLALLLGAVRRRRLLHSLALITAAIVFAVLLNTLRVVSIAVAWEWWEYDLTTGPLHSALGYVYLAVAALLVWNFDVLLSGWTRPVPETDLLGEAAEYHNPYTVFYNRVIASPEGDEIPVIPPRAGQLPYLASPLRLLSFTGAVGVVTVASLASQAVFLTRPKIEPVIALDLSGIEQLTLEALPASVSSFTRVRHETEERTRESREGQFSSIWYYQGEGLTGRVACDLPFAGWHNLSGCYEGTGWTVTESRVDTADAEWPAVRVDLIRHRTGTHAVLFFSLFTASGTPFQPPTPGTPLELLRSRTAYPRRQELVNAGSETIQCQVFAESPVRFDESGVDSVRQLHLTTREELRRRFERPAE